MLCIKLQELLFAHIGLNPVWSYLLPFFHSELSCLSAIYVLQPCKLWCFFFAVVCFLNVVEVCSEAISLSLTRKVGIFTAECFHINWLMINLVAGCGLSHGLAIKLRGQMSRVLVFHSANSGAWNQFTRQVALPTNLTHWYLWTLYFRITLRLVQTTRIFQVRVNAYCTVRSRCPGAERAMFSICPYI